MFSVHHLPVTQSATELNVWRPLLAVREAGTSHVTLILDEMFLSSPQERSEVTVGHRTTADSVGVSFCFCSPPDDVFLVIGLSRTIFPFVTL